MDAFGLHSSAQMAKLGLADTPQGSSVGNKVLNIRNLLSYIPIVSTIVAIAMFIFFRDLERSTFKSGMELRNVMDIFYLVPINFILDIIATLGRNLSQTSK